MKKKILIIISVILLIILSIFIYYKLTFLKRFIIDNRKKWDITLIQNSILSGEYMGILYNQNYTVDTIPSKYLTPLVMDYYINNDEKFFQEENKDENNFYRKIITQEDLNKAAKKMFGPDFEPIQFKEINYGCGRYLIKQPDGNYIISSYEAEYCGIFNDDTDIYLNKIIDYYKEDDRIIVNLKIAYLDQEIDANSYLNLKLFTSKAKNNLLENNYNYNCLNIEEAPSECFNKFLNYQITLKKARNNKYYFYSINKTA